MKQRVVTAVIALAILAGVVFLLPPVATEVALALVLLAAAWEWSGFLKSESVAVRLGYVLFIGAALALVATVLTGRVETVLLAALAWWLGAFAWTFFYPTPVPAVVRWLGGVFVIVPMYAALVALLAVSPRMLMFALLIVWVADSGAFFAGKRFGRIKLAPSISPGKTWEGVIGGLAAVLLLALAAAAVSGLDPVFFVPLCLAVACISIVGDLTVSMFKRDAGLKDSGFLFPGHGGVLDRIDSIAAAAPLFAIGLMWLGTR
ncbi:MAG: phosphatidate cytidylyltransferase [Woeseiaceae bacterium]|nr:phosphatidate cytidylyltransferase [Woeseiaceae bacterium]